MRRFAFALATLPLLLAAGAVPAGAAANDTRVRLVSLSPDNVLMGTNGRAGLDFYVDGRKVLSGAQFDVESTYSSISPGQHTFDVRKAGTPANAAPDASVQQSLGAGYFSVFIGGKVGATNPPCPVKAVIFSDDFPTPPAGKFAARFVHMAPEVPGVDVVVPTTNPPTVLFTNISCFQGSAYSTFPTGTYTFALNATGTSQQLFQTPGPVDLTKSGIVYTFVGAGGVNQPVQLVAIKDAASAGNAPQGAAATGEGGTAFGGLLPLGLIVSSLIACALLLLVARRSPA